MPPPGCTICGTGWYDPGLQQFMSVDPLKSNPDLYEYANDEPAQSVGPIRS